MWLAASSFTLLQLVAIVSIEWLSGSPITIISFGCTKGEKLCQNMTCNMTMSRNRVPMFNLGCLLPLPIYNMTVNLKLLRRRGEKYNVMVGTKENMCAAANEMIRSQVMARIIQSMQKYFSGFKCPFQGKVSATKMPLSLSFVPGFMPTGIYMIKVDLSDSDEPILLVDLKFGIGMSKPREMN